MAPLNQDEQARIDRLAQLRHWRATGEKLVPDDTLAEAEKLAAFALQNAEQREKNARDRDAKHAAEQSCQEAAQQARIDAAAAAYKRTARLGFPGTDQQFEQEWPAILSEWQQRQTLDHLATMAASRPRIKL